jgi:hypothetical protein
LAVVFPSELKNTSLYVPLAFKVSVEKSAVTLMGASFLQLSVFFSCSLSLMFQLYMHYRDSSLVFSVWNPKSLLYLDNNLSQ